MLAVTIGLILQHLCILIPMYQLFALFWWANQRTPFYRYLPNTPLKCSGWTAGALRTPVVNFVAGGVATPADAALMMQLGMGGVFVGSGIFNLSNPEARARAIVKAVTHYKDPKVLMEVRGTRAGHGRDQRHHGGSGQLSRPGGRGVLVQREGSAEEGFGWAVGNADVEPIG